MNPAACCRAFVLSTPLQAIRERPDHFMDGKLALEIVESIGVHGVNPESGYIYNPPRELYRCKALGPDGRCTIYDTRPRMCRQFSCVGATACNEFAGCPSLNATCTGGDLRPMSVEYKTVEARA